MICMSAEVFQKVQAHAGRTYPDECCGMMLGEDRDGVRLIQEVKEIDNSREATRRRRRFLISPAQYLEAEREATRQGKALLGFYHSHPDHPARPSTFDTDHALPWFTYVIIAVAGGQPEELTAWELQEDRSQFTERPVQVEAPGAKSPEK